MSVLHVTVCLVVDASHATDMGIQVIVCVCVGFFLNVNEQIFYGREALSPKVMINWEYVKNDEWK